jgi:hypothetical protein
MESPYESIPACHPGYFRTAGMPFHVKHGWLGLRLVCHGTSRECLVRRYTPGPHGAISWLTRGDVQSTRRSIVAVSGASAESPLPSYALRGEGEHDRPDVSRGTLRQPGSPCVREIEQCAHLVSLGRKKWLAHEQYLLVKSYMTCPWCYFMPLTLPTPNCGKYRLLAVHQDNDE